METPAASTLLGTLAPEISCLFSNLSFLQSTFLSTVYLPFYSLLSFVQFLSAFLQSTFLSPVYFPFSCLLSFLLSIILHKVNFPFSISSLLSVSNLLPFSDLLPFYIAPVYPSLFEVCVQNTRCSKNLHRPEKKCDIPKYRGGGKACSPSTHRI